MYKLTSDDASTAAEKLEAIRRILKKDDPVYYKLGKRKYNGKLFR